MGVAAGAVKQLLELHCPAAGRSRAGAGAELPRPRTLAHRRTAAGIATATARGPAATRHTPQPPHPGGRP